jgi:hypothetical protein
LRAVLNPLEAYKADFEGSATAYEIGGGAARDGTRPLTFATTGRFGALGLNGLIGTYIPGLTFAVREDSSAEGSEDNVAIRDFNIFGR